MSVFRARSYEAPRDLHQGLCDTIVIQFVNVAKSILNKPKEYAVVPQWNTEGVSQTRKLKKKCPKHASMLKGMVSDLGKDVSTINLMEEQN